MVNRELLKKARLRLLQMHFESKVGHIGGNLSALPILLELFHDVIKEYDQFVLSKGHASGAYWITQWSLKKLKDEELKTFHQDCTLLFGHIRTYGHMGSLGHGLPLAVGLAMAKKAKDEKGIIYVLMSDGEWDEGSNWEAARLIHEFDLPVSIWIDFNGWQGFKRTDMTSSFLMRKLEAFGLSGKYTIRHYMKGEGVSFMEDKMEWHYLPMTKEQYLQAVAEVQLA